MPMPSAAARRLHIRDAHVALPESPETPVTLAGVTFLLAVNATGMDHLQKEDFEVHTLLPRTTLVRLVMNHWDDDVTSREGGSEDCRTNDPSTSYVHTECLRLFDQVIGWATLKLQAWAVITARSALAAGDGGPGRTIFTNDTLRRQWVTMWTSLARRYSNWDNIAGFEIMSEPRSTLSAQVIHSAQQEACFGVWRGDPRAACIVGPATYYNRFRLGPDFLISGGGPVIYAANFFEPRMWVQGRNLSYAYGEEFPCCEVYQKEKDAERRRQVCGSHVGAYDEACHSAPLVRVDREWLADELRPIVDFRSRYRVPVWIDQARAASAHTLARHLSQSASGDKSRCARAVWRETERRRRKRSAASLHYGRALAAPPRTVSLDVLDMEADSRATMGLLRLRGAVPGGRRNLPNQPPSADGARVVPRSERRGGVGRNLLLYLPAPKGTSEAVGTSRASEPGYGWGLRGAAVAGGA